MKDYTIGCKTCVYWKEVKTILGHCRRYPPIIECTDKTSFPMTDRLDWCGEYKNKDNQ